jgi:hypothetical protein
MIRKDEQTNDNKVFDFMKLFGMSIQVLAAGCVVDFDR